MKVEDVKLTDIKEGNTKYPPIPPAPTGLKVSAYLIYKDNTTSSIDVLNDNTNALKNTVIDADGVEKSSEQTKIVLTGKLDNLKVTIFKGNRKVENKNLPNFSGDFEFIIKDTGCDELKVIVTKFDEIVYQGAIPYECAE